MLRYSWQRPQTQRVYLAQGHQMQMSLAREPQMLKLLVQGLRKLRWQVLVPQKLTLQQLVYFHQNLIGQTPILQSYWSPQPQTQRALLKMQRMPHPRLHFRYSLPLLMELLHFRTQMPHFLSMRQMLLHQKRSQKLQKRV